MSVMTAMNAPSQPAIFPLPLAPFEEYMVRDERPHYPMVIPLILRFQGSVDRSALEQALEDVLPRQPLLTSCLQRRRGRFRWIPSERTTAIDWEEAEPPGELDAIPGKVIDLTKEPGLRITVWTTGGKTTIACFIHHACTDGLGCFEFISHWLSRYGQLVGDGEGLDAPLPDPELTPQRSELDIELPEPLSKWQITKSTIVEAYKFLTRRPKPLAAEHRKQANTHDAPVLIGRGLDAELISNLRMHAKQQKAGLNDLFIRDMFLTIRDWNKTWGKAKDRHYLRILMPTSLRKQKHRMMPSANVLGYGFLTKTIRECNRPEELLQQISHEIKEIRYWSAGALFLENIRFFQRIPFALKMMTSKRSCHATCVVSNVGGLHQTLQQRRFRREKTIRVGDLMLEDLLIAPPIRPQTWGSMAIVGHRDTVTLSFNVDLNRVSLERANRFLDLYCERLRQTASDSA